MSHFAGMVVSFMREHPGLATANMTAALVLAPIGDVLLPHLYGRLVTAVDSGGKGRSGLVIKARVLAPSLAVIGALALWQGGYIAKDVLDMLTEPRLVDFVRTRMVSSLIERHDGDLSEQLRVGQIVSQLARSPELVAWWTQTMLDDLIPYAASLVWVAAYLWTHDAWLAATLLLFVVAIALLLAVAPRRCIDAATARETALQGVHERADDVMRNLASVYGAGTEAAEVAGISATGDVYRVANQRAMLCLLRYKAIGLPLVVGFVSAVVLRCVYLVGAGRITTGAFVSIFMMTTSIVSTLSWLVMIIKDATLDTGTLTHAHEMFWRHPQRLQRRLARRYGAVAADGLALERVSYEHGSYAMRDVTLRFEAGEITALTGPIGSGKSTVLRLLAGLARPTEGDVHVGGRAYAAVGLKAARHLVGYMPQEAVLFDRTAGENLLYGAPAGATADGAVALAEALGLWDALRPGLPQGLDTRVGKGGSHLSGGQRQLLWFLRVAMRDPPYLLLDEPTASMDAGTRDALVGALERMVGNGDKTVVMTTHDAGLAAFATRTVRLGGPAA